MQTTVAPMVSDSTEQLAPDRSLRWRALLELSKPGITLMEVVTAAVGFLVATPWVRFDVWGLVLRLTELSVGVLLLGASAGTFNHILERHSDATMQRTALRPLPAGRVSVRGAQFYAWTTLVIGTAALVLLDPIVAVLGVATVVLYALAYTPLKPRSAAALFVGGIPGALPVVGGWVAGGGHLVSAEALILGAIMFWWQLPHFLALAIMYADDYRRGGIVLLADGRASALAWHTLVYSVLLVVSGVAWFFYGRGGMLYAVGTAALSVWLLAQCVRLVRQPTSAHARRVLLATYMFLMGLFLLAAVDIR